MTSADAARFDRVLLGFSLCSAFFLGTAENVRADRSRSSNSTRRLAPRCRDARLLICATSSAMAAFNAGSEKNCRLRSLAAAASFHAVKSMVANLVPCHRAEKMIPPANAAWRRP